MDLKAGTDLVVYAVGSLTDNTVTFYTQTIDGLGGAPTAVNTGDGAPSSNSHVPMMLLVAAGFMAFGGTGILILRRRSSR